MNVFSLVKDASDAPVVQVVCQPSPQWPGIVIKPARQQHWDLSANSWVEATVSNTGSRQIKLVMRVDNPGDWRKQPWNGDSIDLGPGQSGKAKVTFGQSWGGPGYKLDPRQVNQVLLFIGKPTEPATYIVRQVVAGGPPSNQP